MIIQFDQWMHEKQVYLMSTSQCSWIYPTSPSLSLYKPEFFAKIYFIKIYFVKQKLGFQEINKNPVYQVKIQFVIDKGYTNLRQQFIKR